MMATNSPAWISNDTPRNGLHIELAGAIGL